MVEKLIMIDYDYRGVVTKFYENKVTERMNKA